MWYPRLCFYQRLSLSLVLVFFGLISLFVVTSSYLQESMSHEGEQRLHLNLATHLVNDNPLLKTGVYNYAALKNLFHTLMVLGPSFEFYFVDADGKILSYSALNESVVTKYIDLEPVKAMIKNKASLPLYGTDPKSAKKKKIFSVAPVYNNANFQGYLYVIIGGEQYDSVLDGLKANKSIQQFALIIIAGTLFLLFALLIIFRYFTLPLKQLSDDVDLFRANGFNLNAPNVQLLPYKDVSRDEVQRLGFSFNEMLKHINLQWNKIKSTDLQRRKLLADLSHDLRTPLANLQGYIETLALSGKSLSEAEHKRFLDISLKNSYILKRLIDQIFELANLERGQIILKNEHLLLPELLHDIAAKFKINAQQKGINLHVTVSQKNAYVYADIAKLERVLTNLLENAIRHTPKDGDILIDLQMSAKQIKVSIIDTGVGIAKDELANIFVARYQATNSNTDTSSHAGLGLAISQKLLAMMGSTLTVTSELGKGTIFSFTLPLIDTQYRINNTR